MESLYNNCSESQYCNLALDMICVNHFSVFHCDSVVLDSSIGSMIHAHQRGIGICL